MFELVENHPQINWNKHPVSMAAFIKEITNQGTLEDGRPFYIYRFILYQDGFNRKKPLCDNRSVSGAYVLPVELNKYYRKPWAAVRFIDLDANGQSKNELMNPILKISL